MNRQWIDGFLVFEINGTWHAKRLGKNQFLQAPTLDALKKEIARERLKILGSINRKQEEENDQFNEQLARIRAAASGQ